MAVRGSSCFRPVIEDFTGDGQPDIIGIGASTHNLKLYENLGK